MVDNGSAAGALLGDDRAYIMLVSEADLDVQRMADAHTGSCATYTVAYDDPASFGRTVRTERLDLPPELASEDAVIVSEVTHSDNPNWADDEVLLGYAAVGDYTVLVLAYHGKEFRTEFDDVSPGPSRRCAVTRERTDPWRRGGERRSGDARNDGPFRSPHQPSLRSNPIASNGA